MKIEIIRESLRRRPFVPFRVHVADGSSYDVTEADDALVTDWWLSLALPSGESRGRRGALIAPEHVTHLETITGGNDSHPARPKKGKR